MSLVTLTDALFAAATLSGGPHNPAAMRTERIISFLQLEVFNV